MKKSKMLLKQYSKEILLSIILIIASIIIFIIGRKLNIDGTELISVSETIFDSLIALITIWISGYFILIQLYKNTYPMEIIEKNFLKKVKKS